MRASASFFTELNFLKLFQEWRFNIFRYWLLFKSNVANSIDFIRKMLHLVLISFDEVFKHLLSVNPNFKVIHFLLKFLRHIPFIHMLSDSNICGKLIIGLPKDIHGIVYRRTEQLRVMFGNEIFTASIVAYGLKLGSIRLQLRDQFSSLNHVAKETIFEVEHMSMSELQQRMTYMIVNVGL